MKRYIHPPHKTGARDTTLFQTKHICSLCPYRACCLTKRTHMHQRVYPRSSVRWTHGSMRGKKGQNLGGEVRDSSYVRRYPDQGTSREWRPGCWAGEVRGPWITKEIPSGWSFQVNVRDEPKQLWSENTDSYRAFMEFSFTLWATESQWRVFREKNGSSFMILI